MCVSVVTSLLAQCSSAWGGDIMTPTGLLLTFCSTGTHTHTNYPSILETHTHIYVDRRTRTHTHTSYPILISHSSSHRGLTDDSLRRTGGVREVQSEGFFGDGRGFKGIPLFLIGRGLAGRWMWKPVRMLLEGVRNWTRAHLEKTLKLQCGVDDDIIN